MSDDKQDNNLECSFCGKKRNDVKKLIAGPTSYICNECISISHKIINEEYDETDLFDDEEIPAPQDIKDYLDEYVISQDYAKDILSVCAYNHYKKILHTTEREKIEKSNVLLLGNTGTGKTLLVKTLANKLNVPFAIADATTLTEAGYVGEDVESVIERLLNVCDWNVPLAQNGIVFIDEIDKKARSSESNANTKDISGEGVQQALLRLIEGTTVKVSANGSKRMDDYIEFDTSNVLFILGGAFVGIDEIVKKKLKQSSVGFNRPIKSTTDNKDWIEHVEHEDIIQYGLIPEFAGRLPNIVGLLDLDEANMFNILKNSKGSVIHQVKRLLEIDDISLEFEEQYLRDVAKIAAKKKVGARGLKSIVENSLHNIMFRAPELQKSEVQRVVFKKYPFSVDLHPTIVYTNGISEIDKDYKIKLRGNSE
ncbi:ATP-dependent Clp protease ATP-binding subunit ClpX [bacterium]|nr:ATP-dependent Clp protease ATP-binding subunit ClpX [bacterium]